MESADTIGFFHDYFLLHLLLNATYISFGMVVGRLLAWVTRVERRYSIRWSFVRALLLTALGLSLLITTQVVGDLHLEASILGGLLIGFGSSFVSRRQAVPPTEPAVRGGASRRPR